MLQICIDTSETAELTRIMMEYTDKSKHYLELFHKNQLKIYPNSNFSKKS